MSPSGKLLQDRLWKQILPEQVVKGCSGFEGGREGKIAAFLY